MDSLYLQLFVGFIGILLIAKPFGGEFNMYDILGIFSGIGAALAYTSIRELRSYYDTRAIVMSFMAVGSVAPLILMLVTPYVMLQRSLSLCLSYYANKIEWYILYYWVYLATLSQYLMTKSYEVYKAGVVGLLVIPICDLP